MNKPHPGITPELAEWIEQQPVCFVATAPLAGDGHINLSPRGLDSIRIVEPHQVAILDLTGSGNETAAHLQENGRITVMFCAFAGKPRILRLYGTGEVVLPDRSAWPELRSRFAADTAGVRQIFRVTVTRVATSCGFGVPLLEYVADRDELPNWAARKGPEGLAEYRDKNNRVSLDGLAIALRDD
ncbi:MAG: pyridoxamine 5'-phosphate oxidase family protein [Pseudomonadota bacterium]|nr:MAG: pyridoxamine 5'-phosphate oxidase family protein [Pseudomonadota bacterium]